MWHFIGVALLYNYFHVIFYYAPCSCGTFNKMGLPYFTKLLSQKFNATYQKKIFIPHTIPDGQYFCLRIRLHLPIIINLHCFTSAVVQASQPGFPLVANFTQASCILSANCCGPPCGPNIPVSPFDCRLLKTKGIGKR